MRKILFCIILSVAAVCHWAVGDADAANSDGTMRQDWRSTASPSGSYKASRNKYIRLGINFLWDYGVLSATETEYGVFPFSVGLGGLIRIGKSQNTFNITTGVRAIMSHVRIEHGYLANDTSPTKLTVGEVLIPAELNWNFFTAEEGSMYLGAGYLYGFRLSSAYKLSFGSNIGRSDLSLYYIHYFKGPFRGYDDMSPFIGMSYTYYF